MLKVFTEARDYGMEKGFSEPNSYKVPKSKQQRCINQVGGISDTLDLIDVSENQNLNALHFLDGQANDALIQGKPVQET